MRARSGAATSAVWVTSDQPPVVRDDVLVLLAVRQGQLGPPGCGKRVKQLVARRRAQHVAGRERGDRLGQAGRQPYRAVRERVTWDARITADLWRQALLPPGPIERDRHHGAGE